MTHGTRWKEKLTIMAHIIGKELLKFITYNLKLMQPGLAKLESGRCMLMRTLSLLLLLALRRQLEKGQPPSTPHPTRRPTDSFLPPPCPENGHHHEPKPDATDEKNLALQPPPPGGRKDKDKDKKTQQGDQGPPQGGDKKSPGEGTSADGDDPEKPPPPPTGEGEGEVEGGPQPGPNQSPSHDPDPDPNRDHEGLLHGVAFRLQTWEAQFDHLVENILGDLKDYWKRLGTPQ